MRTLHVISSLDSRAGGPPAALLGLAAAQRRAGVDVSVVASCGVGCDQDVGDRLRDAGVHVTAVGPARGALARHPDLASTVSKAVAAADVVHVHALWEDIQHQAAVAARRRRVPYIVRPCGMLDPWSLAQSPLKKRLYLAWRLRRNLRHAAALHFTSDAERDLTGPLRLPPPSIVEPNGVDLGEFRALPEPGTFRRQWPQTQGRLLLLFLSRVHPKKGLDLLVPAFARLGRDDVVLAIAGPDEQGYRAAVEQMVRRERVVERVFFTGMLRGAERLAALADADLFVLPSYQENFGIAVVEAMAAGTPVVISDQVNIHADVSAAGAGGVVRTDADALAGELKRWLADDELRRAAGGRAAAFARDRYDWDRIAARWSDHYRQVAWGASAAVLR